MSSETTQIRTNQHQTLKQPINKLLWILLLISCSESNHDLSIKDPQLLVLQDDSISENDSVNADILSEKEELSDLKEIPEFYKISSIVSNIYDESSKTFSQSCGDKEYWEIVKMGENAIPFLISKLNSSVKTTIPVPCSDSLLTEGCLAFILIDEILSIPYFIVFHMQFDSFDWSCDFPHGLLDYVMENPDNTQTKISDWYEQNSNRITKKKMREANQTTCEKENGVKFRLRVN